MRLNDLLTRFSIVARGGCGDPDITDVTSDSRNVVPGSLYVSIAGFKKNGDSFIADALKNGAVAVMSENKQKAYTIDWIQVDNTRKMLGIITALVYNVNLAETTFVAVTGTNGKTTTAYLFQNLFAALFGQNRVWMFGTIKNATGETIAPATQTTPEASDIVKSFSKAGVKPKAIVMEVSSHALALDRVAGLLFNLALWTNLTHDHLDFHKSMEDYYQAKKRLFTGYLGLNAVAIINIDDPWGKRLSHELHNMRQITYGKAPEAQVRIVAEESNAAATTIGLKINDVSLTLRSMLAGHFNVYNMTALVAGAHALSIDMGIVRECLAATHTVPGRMQRVALNAPFSVFVDYAHTPDALENVLSSARTLTRERLFCVFGCGGDRDTTKRPLMGKAVAAHCDEAIVTSDNPRSEKPESIIQEILQGIPLDFPHIAIVDRKEAIRAVLKRARGGDCIVIAGKGHENYQEVKGVKHHFDDVETVKLLYSEAQKPL